MKNVAELAGVSISSVSHVINKPRRVEHETKRKVLDAIEKLNHDRRKYRNLRDYFAEHPEIQGLVCCNNSCCYEAVLEIERIGKNIPDDIKLVTYDDSKWFDSLKYPLSVVVQPTEAIGRLAVDCIIGRIEDGSEPVRKEIILDTEFISRP